MDGILTLVYLAVILGIIYLLARTVIGWVTGFFNISVPFMQKLFIAAVVVAVVAYYFNPTGTVEFLKNLGSMLADFFKRQASAHNPILN